MYLVHSRCFLAILFRSCKSKGRLWWRNYNNVKPFS